MASPIPRTANTGEAVAAEALPDDPLPGLHLAASSRMGALPEPTGESLPTFLLADRLSGVTDVTTVAEGNAELRRLNKTVTADRMTYRHVEDEVEAEGNVVLRDPTGTVKGPLMRLQVDAQTGFFDTPEFNFQQQRVFRDNNPYFIPVPGATKTEEIRRNTVMQGKADRILFEGEQQYRLENATFSTCLGPNPDWYGRVSDLGLDYEREEGEGRNGVLYFKNVPFLYAPLMSFGLNQQRKSGFLAPTFGATSNSGADFSLPYYVNLAPNYDLLVTPRVLTKRGALVNGDFRYLSSSYSGQLQAEYLPNDSLKGSSRHAYNLMHFQDFGRGFTGRLDLQGVSDDTYYTDLASRYAITSQNQLLRRGMLTYSGGWWSATGMVQKYQTLQPDPLAPVAKPYALEPQITVTARRPDFYTTDLAFTGSYSDFRHPTLDEGKRVYAYPTLALPLQSGGLFITPKVGLNMASYSLNRQQTSGENSVSRAIPVFSVDTGAVFERDLQLGGQGFTQTLEPRLFYVNIPYKDQSNVPLFDTSASDINFAQIFTENRYTGADRVGDANQLTVALASRLIRPETGAEVIKALVGQRLYFSDQKVTLNAGDPPSTVRRADWLFALNGQVAPYTTFDAGWQYNPRDARTERLSTVLRYRPEIGKVLQAGYRISRDSAPPFNASIRQIDLAGQWPLGGRWYAVGRYNYSLLDQRLLEGVGGLEYNGGCWVVRGVMQQLAVTSATPVRAFFMQLELSDFASIGSNPLSILRRNIPGYSRTLPSDGSVPVSPYEEAL
ncbi:LPS-assembly protein LptD [Oryzomicrobium terrae]|uniref:LPS-assembly protein LptD n=1 Tax=Oryzomicrobium terrae TaxID=1735038 RepID=UPI0011F02E1C|nr:LPS-assembly protein LptD [Oryzomicrobium terrae]